MHNKANLQRAQGIVDGTLQMGQGATDLASGLNDANAARQQAGAEANSADLKQNAGAYSQTHQDALQASANTLSMGAATSKTDAAWSRAGGSVLAGGKSVADGLLGGAITDDDASAKVHDAAAQSFKQIADDAHDSERDAQAQIDKAIDFYKEYAETKNQAAMAAIQRA
jgi:hypothetical protein